MEDFIAWAASRLSFFMGFEDPSIPRELAGLPSDGAVREALGSLVGTDTREKQDFIAEFISRRRSKGPGPASKASPAPSTAAAPKPYQSQQNQQNKGRAGPGSASTDPRRGSGSPSSSGPASTASFTALSQAAPAFTPSAGPSSAAVLPQPSGTAASAAPIAFGLDPAVSGTKWERAASRCGCQAALHGCFVNCLRCGRIACEAEAAGRCLECDAPLMAVGGGHPVSLGAIQRARGAASGAATVSTSSPAVSTPVSAVSSKGKQQQPDAALAKAMAHKDKLLDFDRSAASRTKVMDDQADYFDSTSSGTSWMSPAERTAAMAASAARDAAKAKGRASQPVTLRFDIGGPSSSSSGLTAVDVEREEANARKAGLVAAAQGLSTKLSATSSTFKPSGGSPAQAPGSSAYAVSPSGGGSRGPERTFANPTLSGRAAEVYSLLIQ